MRFIRKIFVVLLLMLVSYSASADVIVEASCDSVMMWIGEQSGLHISVTCDAGQKVSFPEFRDTIVNKLVIVPPVLTDTQYVDKKKRMTVTRNYTLTAFDSAFFYIPSFKVMVDDVPYESKDGISLAVYTYDLDSIDVNQMFGPKDIMPEPLNWQDVRLAVFSLLLFAALAALAVFLFLSWKNDKPIIRTIKVEPKRPAHEVAMEEIERIRQEQLAHGEDAKQYYTQLTDAVRVYMNDRFGFNATEMTSDEIIEHLSECDKGSIDELRELLSTADLVKFAKLKPLLGENDRNLVTAMEFVKETMSQDEPVEEPKEEKVIVEQKRSREARALLLAAVIAVGAGSAFFLYILIREIYYLFF